MEINTYPWRIRRRSNLGHIFREKKCVLWSEKYGTSKFTLNYLQALDAVETLTEFFFTTVTFLIHFQCTKCNETNSKGLQSERGNNSILFL